MTARTVKKLARSGEIYRGIVTSHPGKREGVESGDPRDSPSQPGSLAAKKPIGWCQPVIYTSCPHPLPVASKEDSATRVARLSLAAVTS